MRVTACAISVITLLSISAALVGCKPASVVPKLQSISGSPSMVNLLAGERQQVKIYAVYNEGSKKMLPSANFTSNNISVAKADELGWIIAGVAGNTTVNVVYSEGNNTKTATIPVSVTGKIVHVPGGGVYVSE